MIKPPMRTKSQLWLARMPKFEKHTNERAAVFGKLAMLLQKQTVFQV
jgi:hypothetical protein